MGSSFVFALMCFPAVSCRWWLWWWHLWTIVWRWKEWEGRGGRRLSSAFLPCMKVREEIGFLFTILHGAHCSRDCSDSGSTWRESTRSFVQHLVLVMSHGHRSVDRKKACAQRSLHSGSWFEVCITTYNTERLQTLIRALSLLKYFIHFYLII